MQRPKPIAELAEELKGWCAKRGIGPEEIDSEELQAWCIKHKVDPTTARRIIAVAARHGGSSHCAGCEHCRRSDAAAATASPSDEVRDDEARDVWDARFTPLGRLPSIADAELESARATLDRNIDTLCRAVELASRACEARSVRPAQEMLRYVSDAPKALRRALRDIRRQRQEHRENERKASVRRMFDLEIKGADPGIVKHVERVGGAGVAGELVGKPLPITEEAVKVYPSLDEQSRAGILNPMSLWSALALDPPEKPPRIEIDALEACAQRLHDDHDRFVAGVDGLDRNTAEHDAHRALQLRYYAAIARREWFEARRAANAIKHDEVRHRWERLATLAERLKVGEKPRRWTYPMLAKLILASDDDWTKPPCPDYVARWRDCEARGDDPVRELAKELSRDLGLYKQEKQGRSRKLGVRVAKPRR